MPAEYFTYQFYTWEYRGRGWFVADIPVHLEPPFIPFIRHLPQPTYIDDGKRPTLVSNLMEWIRGKKRTPEDDKFSLYYNTLEPFAYTEETNLTALQIKLFKERTITPESMKAFLIMLSYILD